MQRLIRSKISLYLCFLVICVSYSSCVTSKKLKYFQDISDSTVLNSIKLPDYHTPLIHPEDILSVTVQTTDITATASVNAIGGAGSSAASSGGSAGATPVGLRVDSLGDIEMPVMGKLHVLNLSLDQAHDLIQERAKKYFLDPVVIVKYLSFKVSVLGEIGRPGVMYLQTPKANIIDLIALAGDLTTFGRRDNVLLIRKNDNNTLSTIRLDLTSSRLIKSPYYYLQSNDVIYVEPTNSKAITSDAVFGRYLTIGTIALSIFTTIIALRR